MLERRGSVFCVDYVAGLGGCGVGGVRGVMEGEGGGLYTV